jgi:hypothetical protein
VLLLLLLVGMRGCMRGWAGCVAGVSLGVAQFVTLLAANSPPQQWRRGAQHHEQNGGEEEDDKYDAQMIFFSFTATTHRVATSCVVTVPDDDDDDDGVGGTLLSRPSSPWPSKLREWFELLIAVRACRVASWGRVRTCGLLNPTPPPQAPATGAHASGASQSPGSALPARWRRFQFELAMSCSCRMPVAATTPPQPPTTAATVTTSAAHPHHFNDGGGSVGGSSGIWMLCLVDAPLPHGDPVSTLATALWTRDLLGARVWRAHVVGGEPLTLAHLASRYALCSYGPPVDPAQLIAFGGAGAAMTSLYHHVARLSLAICGGGDDDGEDDDAHPDRGLTSSVLAGALEGVVLVRTGVGRRSCWCVPVLAGALEGVVLVRTGVGRST